MFSYQNTHDIIIEGDFNENAMLKSNLKHNICLHNFFFFVFFFCFFRKMHVSQEMFVIPLSMPVKEILLLLTSFYIKTTMRQTSVSKEDYGENISDHYPVKMTVSVNFNK